MRSTGMQYFTDKALSKPLGPTYLITFEMVNSSPFNWPLKILVN